MDSQAREISERCQMRRAVWSWALFFAFMSTASALAQPVYFADANLKAAVEAELGVTDPTAEDMLGLTGLDAEGITDLTGIEFAINLHSLLLYSPNQVRDISPLSGLTKLEVLDLWDNQVSDISALSGLTRLTTLFLDRNKISDVSALTGLTNLGELYLSQNPLNRSAYCLDLHTIKERNVGLYNWNFDAPNPNPPGKVSASDGTYADRVVITWEALCPGPDASDTFQYRVSRSATLSAAKEILSSWTSETSFADTTGSPGVHYFYWIESNESTKSGDPDEGWRTHAPIAPVIARSLTVLTASCTQGEDAASASFQIWNSGTGTLNYSITDDANWLSVSPASGSSTGEHDSITVTYGTASLSPGNYSATISIAAAGASNSPRTITVSLAVAETTPGGSSGNGGTAPQVTNVSATQRSDGSDIVDINYTLGNADGDACTVSVLVSDDGGSTWSINPMASALSGAIGEGIYPGSWHISWSSQMDLPGAYGTQYMLMVVAEGGVPDGPDGMAFVSISEPGFAGEMSKYETTNAQYCQYLNSALAAGLIWVVDGIVYADNDKNGIAESCVKTHAVDSYSRIENANGAFRVLSYYDGRTASEHPVTGVSWHGAQAFCDYYGYRLPTEDEWQAVADYDGSYIYGCGPTIDWSMANFMRSNPLGLSWELGGSTTPVGYYADAAYGYGLYDMAGNAHEWTSTVVDDYCVVRGGSWASYSPHDCAVARKHYKKPGDFHKDVGFRVCSTGVSGGIGSGESNIFAIDNRYVTALRIAGPPQVNEGSTADYTCTATYNDGRQVDVSSAAVWSENSSFASISNTGALMAGDVTSNRSVTLTASYGGRTDTHAVTILVQNHALYLSSGVGGSVTPDPGTHSFAPGQVVQISAIAQSNYRFVNWTGTAVDDGKVADPGSSRTTVTMDADYSLIGNFVRVQHTLTLSSGAGGSVVAPGEGTFVYAYGHVAQVTARADETHPFDYWTGTAVDAGKVADASSASTTVTMDADYSLVAHFEDKIRLPGHVRVVDINTLASVRDGSSFATPYKYLSDALGEAFQTRDIEQIWVVAGTYRPDQNGRNPDGSGSRETSFNVPAGVSLYGGFPRGGCAFQDRNAEANATILSGDIGQADNDGDNSYHVLTYRHLVDDSGQMNENDTIILEGFTIRNGQANGSADDKRGGGILCESYNYLEIKDCSFVENWADEQGGGLYLRRGTHLKLTNCRFEKNSARRAGGAIAVLSEVGGVDIWNCVFKDNDADLGGACYSRNSSVNLLRCRFLRNFAYQDGGGLYSEGSENSGSLSMNGCIFQVNQADREGACVYVQDVIQTRVNHCTFHNNIVGKQGIIVCKNSQEEFILTNTILWANAKPDDVEVLLQNSGGDIQACVIMGGEAGISAKAPSYLRAPRNDTYSCKDIDPLLTPDGHLRNASPCQDEGIAPDLHVIQTEYDLDGDERPRTAGMDIGADEFVGGDNTDNLPHWWEQRYFGHLNLGDTDDPDEDGLTNLEEYERYGSHPNEGPYYVNLYDGANSDTTRHFATIAHAIEAAGAGDTILVGPGIYKERLNFNGKGIVLCSQPPLKAKLDGGGISSSLIFKSRETPSAAVVGFRIINSGSCNSARASLTCENAFPLIRGCVFEGSEDALQNDCVALVASISSMPVFDECQFWSHGWEWQGIVIQQGELSLVGSTQITQRFDHWKRDRFKLSGEGTFRLGSLDTRVGIYDADIRDCNIVGPGTVSIPLYSSLSMENTTIDLSGPDANGTIECNGLLRVTDAHVKNAKIKITRANFEGNASVSNSVITAEAGVPYGQFFVEGYTHVLNNTIYADGDRYLDLNPVDIPILDINDNRFNITITEGQNDTRAGLLELRGLDQHCQGLDCNSGVFDLEEIEMPDFDTRSWTIDRLELKEGAKVNLTNRFDFGNGAANEVMYVKNLILREGSKLNTSFNRLYYEELLEGDLNKNIVNIPLLGFSLSTIAFNDADEFLVRVKHNNDELPFGPDPNRVHVARVPREPPDNGMMSMENFVDEQDPGQVYQARAKGLFAKADEGRILITFEYLFEALAAGTQLRVYLSDEPELQDPDLEDWDYHHVEVDRHIIPPRPGRPGSVGSDRFGIFHQYVDSEYIDEDSLEVKNLNFIKGVYIELQLISSGPAKVFIDNWDPQIHCPDTVCMDLFPSGHVNYMDLIPVLSELGARAELGPDGMSGNECVDSMFCRDGYADVFDASSLQYILNNPDLKNLCPGSIERDADNSLRMAHLDSAPDQRVSPAYLDVSEPLPDTHVDFSDLLVVGTRPWFGMWSGDSRGPLTSQGLFALNSIRVNGDYQCQQSGTLQNNTSVGRLIRGQNKQIYMTCMGKGVYRIEDNGDPVVVLYSGQRYDTHNDPRHHTHAHVYVGLQQDDSGIYGRPIWDVAVSSSSTLYVAPVVVVPDGHEPYLSVAPFYKQDRGYVLFSELFTYDDTRSYDPNNPDNPNLNSIREIEVDRSNHVYVLNVNSRNDGSFLWKHVPGSSVSDENRLALSGPESSVEIPDPIGLCVSNRHRMAFLGSGQHDLDAPLSTKVYGFSADQLSQIACRIEIGGIHQVSDITEDPSTGDIWVLGFSKDEDKWKRDSLEELEESFFQPSIARIVSDKIESAKPEEPIFVTAKPIEGESGHQMDLPLSFVWTGAE